jgi:hypothetical protein
LNAMQEEAFVIGEIVERDPSDKLRVQWK